MGQKINPIGLRLGINRTWDSRWFAGKQEYGKLLHEDVKIREILHKELKQAAVARIVIERPHKKCRVTIHSARPGVVIGKKGADIDKLRKKVADITSSDVVINIVEIRKPELDATLVAESIAQQLERRVAFRRAMKRAVQSAMRLGAEGIRINCSGRLGGAEIARMEWYREGRVPLHTLRADIDFGFAEAKTTYGIYRPERLNLHSVWDGLLAERAISSPPPLVRRYPAAERRRLAAGTVTDWSRESWEDSKKAYAAAMGGDPCAPTPPRMQMDDATIASLVPMARDEVVKGGLRLARLLDAALG